MKLADGGTAYPAKNRFNQDLDESVKEIKSKMDTKSQLGDTKVSLN